MNSCDDDVVDITKFDVTSWLSTQMKSVDAPESSSTSVMTHDETDGRTVIKPDEADDSQDADLHRHAAAERR
jgi:hypothetical protein